MPDQQPSRRLVGKLDLALGVDGEKGGRSVVEHRLEEAGVVAEAMALVAEAPHALFQRLAEFAEAAAFVAMGEILGEIAEAYRIDEARQLDIGALDETPRAGDSADAEQAGEKIGRREWRRRVCGTCSTRGAPYN